MTVGSNVLVTGTGREAIIDENNSPAAVVNPTEPNNVVIVNRLDRPRYSAALHWSTDGGRSWTDTALPLPGGRDRPYAPDAAFSPDGILYVTYVNLEGTGNDPQTLWIARSIDGGRTLGSPVQVAGRYSFQARVVAERGGRVHVTWLRGSTVGLLSLNEPANIVMASSTDGGTTFSAPVSVSDPGRSRVGAATPVVDINGDLLVLYEDFKGDARDFLNLEGPAWDKPVSLVVARSSDRGRSFAPGIEVDAGVILSERFLVYLPRFPSIAAGPGGAVYVAWADGRSGVDKVLVRQSHDSGVTWGAAIVATSPGASVPAWLPTVRVAPGGRVDLLYLAGHRDSADGLVNAYLATSVDGGQTFQTVRVSSSAFNSRIGPLTGPTYLSPDLGTQLALESTDSGAFAAWVDTRLGSADTGRQDIFSATIDAHGSVSAIRVVATVVMIVASIVAGVAGFGGLTARRRRQGGN